MPRKSSLEQVEDSPTPVGLSYLDQLNAIAEEMPCKCKSTPFLALLDHDTRSVFVTRARCNMWNCESCAKRKRDQWAVRVYKGIVQLSEGGYEQWSFVTITSSGKLKNFAQTNHVLSSAWAKLSTRMRRAFDKPHYVLIPERHKNGRLHLHMLVSALMTTRWIKDNAPQCGFGYKCESTPVQDAALAAWYVTKYISKNLADAEYPPNFRRVRTSQGFPQLNEDAPETDDYAWMRMGTPEYADKAILAWHNRNYRVLWLASGELMRPD